MARRSWLCLMLLLAGVAAAAPPEDSPRRTAVVSAVDRARLSVVNISTEKIVHFQYRDPFFGSTDDTFDQSLRDFFREGQGPARKVESPLGSGIVIDAAGYVVTNEHVVRRASGIKLSLADGSSYDAVLLAADPARDMALLKVEKARELKPIALGTSSDLMLGETVIALGNPFGFENSVTTGIISALHRSVTVGQGGRYEDLIQTSALINPGNSGGPLLNIEGELIGMNAAVVGGAQGIGFAIPVDAIRDVLADLLASPRVTKLWFGASLERDANRAGAKVASVEAGSPAFTADVRRGDVIVSADGKDIQDPFDLSRYLLGLQPGDKLPLHLVREGKRIHAELALVNRPRPTPAKLIAERLGVSGQELTPKRAAQLGLSVTQGVALDEVTPDGPAARAGLQPDDVIIQVGPHRIRNVEEMAAALQSANAGDSVFIQVVRGRYLAYTRVAVR